MIASILLRMRSLVFDICLFDSHTTIEMVDRLVRPSPYVRQLHVLPYGQIFFENHKPLKASVTFEGLPIIRSWLSVRSPRHDQPEFGSRTKE